MSLNNPNDVLDVAIDLEQPENTLFSQMMEVVRTIVKGAWIDASNDSIEVKKLTGGITNVLYVMKQKSSGAMVIIRMYGFGTSDFIDRSSENIVFSKLSQMNFGPTFYGVFQNGRLEGYLPAVALESAEMGNPLLVPSIAAAVAHLHQIEVKEVRRERWLWSKIETFVKLAEGRCKLQYCCV